jgi:hypothetical protein
MQPCLLLSWCLWKERNARVFNGVSSAVSRVAGEVQLEDDRWIGTGFSALSVFFSALAA